MMHFCLILYAYWAPLVVCNMKEIGKMRDLLNQYTYKGITYFNCCVKI